MNMKQYFIGTLLPSAHATPCITRIEMYRIIVDSFYLYFLFICQRVLLDPPYLYFFVIFLFIFLFLTYLYSLCLRQIRKMLLIVYDGKMGTSKNLFLFDYYYFIPFISLYTIPFLILRLIRLDFFFFFHFNIYFVQIAICIFLFLLFIVLVFFWRGKLF